MQNKNTMWRRLLKSFLSTLAIVILAGAPIIYSVKNRKSQTPVVVAPEEKPKTTAKRDNYDSALTKKYITLLISQGWNEKTARAVITMNKQWFSEVAAEDELAFSKQLTLLADLGRIDDLMTFLDKHPETAALFTLVSYPEKLLRLLLSAENNFNFIINLYVLHAAPIDADDLTEALQDNIDIISKLYQRGLVGSEVIFIFGRQGEGTEIYEQWLRELLMTKMDKPDLEIASLINMIITYGPDIRRRLQSDNDFRSKFRTLIWPKLVRVASYNKNMYEIYLDDPRIWDLLTLPEGEALLRKRGLLLPMNLLYGYPELNSAPYPDDLHPYVIQKLLEGDILTIKALHKFRDEPLFHSLLRRPLSDDVKRAAFTKLLDEYENSPEQLKQFDKMTGIGLKSELGPGPSLIKIWTPLYYTLWEVPKKLMQGRNPSGTEWFNSLADPVSFLYPILKLGVAVVNVGKSITGLEEKKPFPDELKKTSVAVAEKQLGKDIARRLSDNELVNYGVTAMLTKMQGVFKEKVSKSVIVNTTKPVQFMFSYSGNGQKSLAALAEINGSILMRGDMKLVIQPNNQAIGKNVSKYLTTTSRNFVTATLNLRSSGTSQTDMQDNHDQQYSSWSKNVSAWWLMHASNMFN